MKQDRQAEPKVWCIGCGNGQFGCGKQCRILKTDPISKAVLAAEGFHAGVNLCLGCANSVVYNWKIGFEDLDYLMVAIHNAKAGKCGVPPERKEVMDLFHRMKAEYSASLKKNLA